MVGEKRKTPQTNRRKALIDEQYFDFVRNINKKTLELSDPETGDIVMGWYEGKS
ncbi:MAG: hypothetical protein IH947_05495 [Bacteroidetes bacterium]|nr:hypothetical protein [Bacteroidota bacterium]